MKIHLLNTNCKEAISISTIMAKFKQENPQEVRPGLELRGQVLSGPLPVLRPAGKERLGWKNVAVHLLQTKISGYCTIGQRLASKPPQPGQEIEPEDMK